jgi:hypothetical protein
MLRTPDVSPRRGKRCHCRFGRSSSRIGISCSPIAIPTISMPWAWLTKVLPAGPDDLDAIRKGRSNLKGEWGVFGRADWEANDRALANGDRSNDASQASNRAATH